MKDLETELIETKNLFENSKKDYIERHTQLKILKQSLNERNENIEMLSEEVETWMTEYEKEKLNHNNTTQTLAALEIKIAKEKERAATKMATVIQK